MNARTREQIEDPYTRLAFDQLESELMKLQRQSIYLEKKLDRTYLILLGFILGNLLISCGLYYEWSWI